MRAPFAEWRGPLPASNYRAGPSPKIGLAFHVIVGSLSSADGEFRRPGTQLSAHFGIGGPGDPNFADGQIVQWLDTDDDCFAQGAGNYPPTAYIGVEVAGDPSKPMTSAQVATLGRIVAWAAGVHDFPLVAVDHGGHGITTHCHYPSGVADPLWGGHPCPGPLRLAQMPAVLAAAESPDSLDPLMEAVMSLAKSPADAARGLGRFFWEVSTNEEPDEKTLEIIAFAGLTNGFEALVTSVQDSPLAQTVRAARVARDNG